jgi:hypothetical protein
MKVEQITGIIRHILTTVGGVLISTGVAEKDQVELIAGGVAALIGVAWSWFSKRKAEPEL